MKFASAMTTNRPPESDSLPARLLLLCSVALLTAAVLRAQPLQSANDRSRWCTVWSLVERGTYQIDEIDRKTRFSTIDKVRHRLSDDQPWHFYSSKPPLLSTLVAGLYWVERRTLGMDLFVYTHAVTRLLLLFVNLLPMALALLALDRSLRYLQVSSATRLFVLATAGLGSMLNPYLTTLNNHTPAAICVMFCLSAMIRLEASRTGRDQPADPAAAAARSGDFLLLGLCAGLTACFELPSALFGLLTCAYACRVDWRRAVRWYVPAAILPLAAFFITNWLCTGGLRPFYTYYGTDKYVYVHEGVPSYWSQPRDLDANQETWPVYLFHCVLGHHGLLSLSPVLCLTVLGWLSWGVSAARRGHPAATSAAAPAASSRYRADLLRPVMLSGAVLTLATLGFYLTRTQNYNYGGNSVALRWMLWLTPFWWLAMVPVLQTWLTQRLRTSLALLLLGLSITSASWSQDRPWRPSWLYEMLENAGWIQYRTPPAAKAPAATLPSVSPSAPAAATAA